MTTDHPSGRCDAARDERSTMTTTDDQPEHDCDEGAADAYEEVWTAVADEMEAAGL